MLHLRSSVFSGLALLTLVLANAVVSAPLPPPPNLAASLTQMKPLENRLVLTVSAAQCPLPAEETAPNPDASVQVVANKYHQTVRVFGTVTAVAPPTMTLLNNHPVNPNIYDGMPPQEALKFLVATLTEAQWQQLTSQNGLGLPDMASETQSSLFAAVLPRTLQVAPEAKAAAPNSGARDLTSLLPQVRLCLHRRVEIMVPEAGSTSYLIAEASRDTGQTVRYHVVSDPYFAPKSSVYGVPVKAEVPNAPKPSALDLHSKSLQVAVPFAGAGTVGEVLSRIGKLSGMELYADPRFENRPVTLVSTAPSAPASDLLASLAFCLTGTYRQVGTAFVLTDDNIGVGTRRAIWVEFEADAARKRKQALVSAGSALTAAHTLAELSPEANSIAYSTSQQKLAQSFYLESGSSSVTQTLNQLTPEQQTVVEALQGHKDSTGIMHTPDVTGKMIVQEVPTLDLVVPTLDQPLDAGLFTTLYALFQSPVPTLEPLEKPVTHTPSAVTLSTLIQPIPERAVLASPHTAAEVKSLVADMKRLGLNELWIPVAADFGMLPQVLQETRGTGISVYAVMDLLTRPVGVPKSEVDLDILGDSSSPAKTLSVSPFSESVRKQLLNITHTLVGTPGLAGIVWQTTEAPGYDKDDNYHSRDAINSLGYTVPARAAFLRKAHADPVDLFPSEIAGQADTSLPAFDNSAVEASLLDQWHLFRVNANLSLLQSLYQQFATDTKGLSSKQVLLVQQRGARPPSSWYGSWDGREISLPTFRPYSSTSTPEKVQAKAFSKTTVVSLPIEGSLSEAAVLDKWATPLQLIGKNHSWDGFVIECHSEAVSAN